MLIRVLKSMRYPFYILSITLLVRTMISCVILPSRESNPCPTTRIASDTPELGHKTRMSTHSTRINKAQCLFCQLFVISCSFLSDFIVFGKLQDYAMLQCVHNDATTIIE